MPIIPRRRGDRGRFRAGRMYTERERREHMIAALFAASVKIGLFVALLVAAFQAHRVTKAHAAGAGRSLRVLLPLLLLAGCLVALRVGLRSLREARDIRRTPLSPPGEDG